MEGGEGKISSSMCRHVREYKPSIHRFNVHFLKMNFNEINKLKVFLGYGVLIKEAEEIINKARTFNNHSLLLSAMLNPLLKKIEKQDC
jgi:hypothetical protein